LGAGSPERAVRQFNILGRHVIGELYECDPARLTNLEAIKLNVRAAALKAGAIIVGDYANKYDYGNGISYILVIKESHISVHSWPEHGYASVDVYTCGGTNPWAIFNEIVSFLNPRLVSAVEIRRGALNELASQKVSPAAVEGNR